MKRPIRSFDIFSLSLLDVVSCGFGAIILLVLISDFSEAPPTSPWAQAEAVLREILSAEAKVEALRAALAHERAAAAAREARQTQLRAAAQAEQSQVAAAEAENRRLDENLSGLALAQQALRRAATQADTAQQRDEEVGGIPVDSDYVIFVVDTSGSMQTIWPQVTRELENVINIHPQVKGFQILDDNGGHLLAGYAGRWIPDTPQRRQSVIRLFRTWQSASSSSPVEGLQAALKRYAKPGVKLSIYIFGDDYSGGSYDPVIQVLDRLNTSPALGARLAKVHAVGFISPRWSHRFPTLMREVTRRNGGTFIALPVRSAPGRAAGRLR